MQTWWNLYSLDQISLGDMIQVTIASCKCYSGLLRVRMEVLMGSLGLIELVDLKTHVAIIEPCKCCSGQVLGQVEFVPGPSRGDSSPGGEWYYSPPTMHQPHYSYPPSRRPLGRPTPPHYQQSYSPSSRRTSRSPSTLHTSSQSEFIRAINHTCRCADRAYYERKRGYTSSRSRSRYPPPSRQAAHRERMKRDLSRMQGHRPKGHPHVTPTSPTYRWFSATSPCLAAS